VRELKRRGMGALLEPAKPLTAEQVEALACWRFLGGWYPERLPLWLALHPTDDIEALICRLEAIRDAVDDAARPRNDED
jgi:hypothetical protein